MSSNYIDKIKKRENNKNLSFKKSGWNKAKQKWYPHPSLERGFKTIAYGHKLDESGYFTIGGERFNARDGITDKQADQLVKKDFAIARKSALAHAKKGGLDHIEGLVDATASLIMNVRADSWAESDALKALERGDIETYILEAFGEKGFNKITNPDTEIKEFSKGLYIRRIDELGDIKLPKEWMITGTKDSVSPLASWEEMEVIEALKALKKQQDIVKPILDLKQQDIVKPILDPAEWRGWRGREPNIPSNLDEVEQSAQIMSSYETPPEKPGLGIWDTIQSWLSESR